MCLKMKAKVCKQCGDMKPLDQFRPYYGGRKGTYTRCLQCERINSREKYLSKKKALTDAERKELDKIHQLYEAQRSCGLSPPNTKQRISDLDGMIKKYEQPTDLSSWLTAELTRKPEYYLDTVYEELKRKYRPVVGIDQQTLLPIYNEDHHEELEQILTRFYTYEEEYYGRA